MMGHVLLMTLPLKLEQGGVYDRISKNYMDDGVYCNFPGDVVR